MHGAMPNLWQRYLALILDGLRPESATPLGQIAPTLADFDAAVSATN
jgi:hypothetical protein